MKLLYQIAIICTLLVLSGCTRGNQKTYQDITPSELDAQGVYEIGSVDTAFKFIGPDHKIEVGAVPDPKVQGVTCFYSRAKTGGIRGGLGIAQDTSDASVACRQTGPIDFTQAISASEEIRNQNTSFWFKKIRIVRFYDTSTNSLIYLVYSDKLIDGSPKNSISAVALGDVVPSIVQ